MKRMVKMDAYMKIFAYPSEEIHREHFAAWIGVHLSAQEVNYYRIME